MSVANILGANGLVAGRMLDTSSAPLSLYAGNPATANQDMASFDINACGDCAVASISHAAGGINVIGVQNSLEMADVRFIAFQGPTQGRVSMNAANDLAVGNVNAAEVVVEGASESVKVNVAASGAAGEFLVGGTSAGSLAGAAGYISMGDTALRSSGAQGGTFTFAKNLAAASVINDYLAITVNGVPYWIPLCAVDPQVA